MIGSWWELLLIDAVVASLAMAVLWLLTTGWGDASPVDVAWSYGIGVMAALDALLASGASAHRLLIAVVVVAWSARLGTHLLVDRVLHAATEDGRYQALRCKWGEAARRRFFVFFQAQAALVVVFSSALIPTVLNRSRGLAPIEWIGGAAVIVGIAGEATADRQLRRWRGDPDNRGRTCRAGLWRLSRHPNYFFESVTWIGVTLIALAAPWGWSALVAPVVLLALLFGVTGIPATEAQSLRSRGDDYRRYQAETSAFVPWFPKRARQLRADSPDTRSTT